MAANQINTEIKTHKKTKQRLLLKKAEALFLHFIC